MPTPYSICLSNYVKLKTHWQIVLRCNSFTWRTYVIHETQHARRMLISRLSLPIDGNNNEPYDVLTLKHTHDGLNGI